MLIHHFHPPPPPRLSQHPSISDPPYLPPYLPLRTYLNIPLLQKARATCLPHRPLPWILHHVSTPLPNTGILSLHLMLIFTLIIDIILIIRRPCPLPPSSDLCLVLSKFYAFPLSSLTLWRIFFTFLLLCSSSLLLSSTLHSFHFRTRTTNGSSLGQCWFLFAPHTRALSASHTSKGSQPTL